MIKYIIVEDERLAYQELKRMIALLRPEYKLEKWTENVSGTVDFLENHQVDLILMDINLSDGNCFEIFDKIKISTPVIFTTAYDLHAIKAFKFNSIDYLLKPVEEDALSGALNKYEQIYKQNTPLTFDYRQLEYNILQRPKERFLVKNKDSYTYVESCDIALFYSEDKAVFIHTFSDKRYIIDYTLDLLEKQLAIDSFFRLSRNCISNIKAINTINKHFNGRLKVTFQPSCPHEILVSHVRVNDFLQWMDGIIRK